MSKQDMKAGIARYDTLIAAERAKGGHALSLVRARNRLARLLAAAQSKGE